MSMPPDSGFSALSCYSSSLVQRKPRFLVEKSAAQSQYYSSRATQASGSSLGFVFQSPSYESCISRRVEMNCVLNLQFIANVPATTAVGAPIAVPGRDIAPRDWPIASLTTAAVLSINSQQISSPHLEAWPALAALTAGKRQRRRRTFPAARQYFRDNDSAYLSRSDAMASALDVDSNSEEPNGAFPGLVFCDDSFNPLTPTTPPYSSGGTVVACSGGVPVFTAGQTAVPIFVQLAVQEPCTVAPCVWDAEDASEDQAFVNVNQLNLQLQLQSPAAARLIQVRSNAAGASAFSISGLQFGATPFASASLITLALTPPLSLAPVPQAFYEFGAISAVTANGPSIAPGASFTLQMPQQMLPAVPYVFLLSVSPQSYDTTDAATWFLPPSAVQITWQNRPALSSANQQALYDISTRNGLDMSWSQWSGRCVSGGAPAATSGGFLVLTPADLGCADGVAAGVQGTFAASFGATFVNTSSVAVVPQMTLTIVYASYLALSRGSAFVVSAPLSEVDALRAPSAGPVAKAELAPHAIGAGLWDRISGAITKHLPKVLDVAKEHGPGIIQKLSGSGVASAGLLTAGGKRSLAARLA